jgi:PKD repeat protein
MLTSALKYTTPGVYTVQVTVADNGGSGSRSGAQETTAFVVVYDPTGGFVTGGRTPSCRPLAPGAVTGR